MKESQTSTLDVNHKSLVLLMLDVLTFKANNKPMDEENKFGKWLKPLIEKLKPISQADVAKEVGITDVHLSRIVTGAAGASRKNAIKIINAINKLARSVIADKTEGLSLVGFSSDEDTTKIPKPIAQVDFSGFNNWQIDKIVSYINFTKWESAMGTEDTDAGSAPQNIEEFLAEMERLKYDDVFNREELLKMTPEEYQRLLDVLYDIRQKIMKGGFNGHIPSGENPPSRPSL